MPRLKMKMSNGFTIINNTILRDSSIGSSPRGTYVTMLSMADGWNFTVRGLAKIMGEGVTKISNSLHVLEEKHYLKRVRVYENGRIVDWDYYLYDEPYPFDTADDKCSKAVSQDSDLQDTDILDTENLNQVNQDFEKQYAYKRTNKEKSIKEISCEEESIDQSASSSDKAVTNAYKSDGSTDGYSRDQKIYTDIVKENIGRVQTPTLAMIVQRDAEVNGFVKQKYFTADLNCGDFILSSARIDDESAADTLVSACDGKSVTISSVKREVKTDKAPKLYDLTTLQREANKAFGYTAQQTLDYTQSLYEGKLVTYPRTDSQYLSDDMVQTAFDVLWLCDRQFGFGISHTPDISKVINNSKVSGHHAIIPTNGIATADLSSLPRGERNILTLIATKLICATAPVHKYETVKLTGVCNDTEFTATGRTVLDMGWKAYAKQSDKKNDEKALPAVSEGQTFTVSASKGEHFTSPPKPYTEDTLLSAMEHAGNEDYEEDTEKKGLGTPATRAATIEALVKNGYVERDGKQLRATDKGKELVTVVPDEVKSAKLTAEWESKLQQIEHGSLPEAVFMSGIQQFVAEMCRKYGSVDKSVTLSDNYEPVGNCPKCGAEVVKGKFGYYCKGKCGMNIAKVYGVELSDAQVKALLGGKSTSYTSKGKKTIVRPEIVENPYNGKTYVSV